MSARCCAVAVALLALGGCGGGTEGPPDGPSSERLTLRPAGTVDGAPLGYAEYLPPDYGNGESRPLLIFMHGSGENGDGGEEALRLIFKLGVPKLIENDEWPQDRPFIVLMPQYPPEEAEECRHADEVDSFLRFAMDHYEIDESRVYLTGVSCGAIGMWDYLGTHKDKIVAGAVLIAAHTSEALDRAGCELGRVPIWAFHGTVDEIVPKRYIVEPLRRLKACMSPKPRDARLTLYPGADHDAWSQTYDLSGGHDIYAWLLGHKHH